MDIQLGCSPGKMICWGNVLNQALTHPVSSTLLFIDRSRYIKSKNEPLNPIHSCFQNENETSSVAYEVLTFLLFISVLAMCLHKFCLLTSDFRCKVMICIHSQTDLSKWFMSYIYRQKFPGWRLKWIFYSTVIRK